MPTSILTLLEPLIKEFERLRVIDPDLSSKRFCKERGINDRTFSRNAIKLGVDPNLQKVVNQSLYVAPTKQSSFDGAMLGDGSIFFSTKTAVTPVYSHSSKHLEYLEWVTSKIECLHERTIYTNHRLDKRTNKTYYAFWTKSKSSQYLLQQLHRWYPQQKKIVPHDIVIDSDLLLHWYLDDGSNGPHNSYLSCDDFTLQEVELLNEKVRHFTKIPTFIYSGSGNLRIYIPGRYRTVWFEILGNSPVRCFDYKWCD